MMIPGTPRLLRGINDRAALDLLLDQGPLTRTQIGELTGLSKPTASQLLARLEESGLVFQSGDISRGHGPRAQLYAVNPAAGYVAGLDVRVTRILVAIADITGRTIGEYELPTSRTKSGGAVENVVFATRAACTAAGLRDNQLGGMAIGVPGAFDVREGRLRFARHLVGWHDKDLIANLSEGMGGIPVEIHNDVNLAAIAEMAGGRGELAEDVVVLWADHGLGAALIVGGRLHTGASGGAGEIGFMPLPGADVDDVHRSDSGGFQKLAGGPAVLALGRSHGHRAATPHEVVAAAQAAGDEVFLTELARRFALGIASMVVTVDPEVVVLAGRVLLAGGEPLRELIAAEIDRRTITRPRVVFTAVEDLPVLRGALDLALDRLRDRVFDTVSLEVQSTSRKPSPRRSP